MERKQFGQRIADFQGLSFMLADMATQVEAARALYLSAARRKDAGQPFGPQAAMSKLFASDTAMRVTTDRSEEHTSELQSLMRTSYAVFCLKKKNKKKNK